MTTLVIDTSTRTARVALESAGKILAERVWEGDRTLGRVLLEKIDEMLVTQQMGWGEIADIAVADEQTGGSFMAQRTGLVTASMLGAAHGKRVAVRKAS